MLSDQERQEFKRLTPEERQEMDITRLQQYLMELGKYGADLTDKLITATEEVTIKRTELIKAEGVVEEIKKQQAFVKEEKSLTQTVLRTMPI